jgi:vacuolar-type H+-ATPase subunit E/Vma4
MKHDEELINLLSESILNLGVLVKKLQNKLDEKQAVIVTMKKIMINVNNGFNMIDNDFHGGV